MRTGYTQMDTLQVDLPIEQPLSGMAMHAFLALAAEARPEKIPQAIARCACHAVLADICYLVSTPENGSVTCFDGFNRVKEEILPSIILPIDHFPELGQSFLDGKPCCQNDPAKFPELTRKTVLALAQVRAAPYCIIPVITAGREILGALLLMTPYTGREWSQNDISQLLAIADAIAKILERILKNADLEDRLKAMEEVPQPTVESPGNWILESTGETIPAAPQPDEDNRPPSRTGMFNQPYSDLNEMVKAENQMLLEEIANMRTQLQQLAASTSITAATQQDEQVKLALEQIRADLHAMLSPLSAITGYHDLLASESVGSLTTMQQRFLERIRTAADKLHHSIDHIDQVVQGGPMEAPVNVPPPSVSLSKMIEESFGNYQNLIHERELDVRLVVPEDLPEVRGSINELQPVINKILNSLLSVTPNKSSIQSRLALQDEGDGKKSILWKATTHAETEILPGKDLDEFSEYLHENVFNLAERLNCQLWMDSAVHTERQVNLLFAAA
jgi:signal transduction histidine kinase